MGDVFGACQVLDPLTVCSLHGFQARQLVDLTDQIKEPTRCGGGAYGDVYKCRLSDSSSVVSCSTVYSFRALNVFKVAVKSLRYFVDDREMSERLERVGASAQSLLSFGLRSNSRYYAENWIFGVGWEITQTLFRSSGSRRISDRQMPLCRLGCQEVLSIRS